MSLLVWSEEKPDWQRDALRRIAVNGQLTEADQQAIHDRLKHAHGIAVEGDVACAPLTNDHLPSDADAVGPTILCGIGPVANVDQLAPDQELRFGLNGLTLVFGDNGTGKSGYARVEEQLDEQEPALRYQASAAGLRTPKRLLKRIDPVLAGRATIHTKSKSFSTPRPMWSSTECRAADVTLFFWPTRRTLRALSACTARCKGPSTPGTSNSGLSGSTARALYIIRRRLRS